MVFLQGTNQAFAPLTRLFVFAFRLPANASCKGASKRPSQVLPATAAESQLNTAGVPSLSASGL
jgi:hypothetical protein